MFYFVQEGYTRKTQETTSDVQVDFYKILEQISWLRVANISTL